jgi:hypothetical protein
LHWWLVNCYKKVEGESFLLKSCLSDPRRYNLAQSIRHRKDKRRRKGNQIRTPASSSSDATGILKYLPKIMTWSLSLSP